VAAGYAFLKSTRGRQSADEVRIPSWRLRQACGSDASCIRQRQVEAITAYQAAGAPVSLPHWAGGSSSQPVAAPNIEPASREFVVDGLALGGSVYPESAVYKAYKCKPSDDFLGFTWCGHYHNISGERVSFTSWVTILHSSTNRVVFVTQLVTPAYFAPGDVDREIARLSKGFGQAARTLTADAKPGLPHAILVAWGDAILTPLGDTALDALRRGEQIHRGLIADFIGNAQESARVGLPVYRIGGGPGFLWGASFDDAGKGSLRMSAVDASALGKTQPTPSVVANSAVHEAFPVWEAQMTQSEANDGLQYLSRQIVALDEMIANLEAMIRNPATDQECYDVNRSLNLPAAECVDDKRKLIVSYNEDKAKYQATIDRGMELYINEAMSGEIKDREYLRAHWSEFTDQAILNCESAVNDIHLSPSLSYSVLSPGEGGGRCAGAGANATFGHRRVHKDSGRDTALGLL
jgi:hypothetical protein